MKNRITRLLDKLPEHGLDVLLVHKGENIRYLSGFTGGSDAVLLISSDVQAIFTDTRYTEQVRRECPGWDLHLVAPPGQKELISQCKRFQKIGFESHFLTYQEYLGLDQELGGKLTPAAGLVEELRMIKDDSELECLRGAAHAGDLTFTDICSVIKVGVSEKYIANNIVYNLKKYACAKESFDTIAISGENAALPHGQPGDKLLVCGDMLTMDFGGFYQGYAGDMTRTVAVGRADQEYADRYHAVLEAQKTGVSIVQAGVSCKAIDLAVRECLQKYDLDEYFVHGTGHGVGLEIHEAPRVSMRSDEILQKNMVVTVEPGIYIPGWGGIRIEDTVIVKDGRCEIITCSNKELLIIDGGIE